MGENALSVGMPRSAPPPGWKWTPLTDVARLESGHTPSRKHPEYWGGGVPWISIPDAKSHHGGTIYETMEQTNELGIANSSARVLPAGTICLSRTASVGYVVMMGRPMATSQDFVNWVCSTQLEPRFLQYLLIAENGSLSRFSSGAVHQTIYFPEAKAFHVCLPPVEEQRRIVAVLDEACGGIATATANAKANSANAKLLFDAWLRDAIDPASHQGWGRVRLSELTTKIGSGATPRGGRESYLAEGVPLVRSLNVHDRHFKPDQLAYLDASQAAQLASVTLLKGDVLLNITGASVARCCLLPDNLAGGRVNQHVAIVRSKPAVLEPKFLELVLTSPHYKDRLLGVGSQGGSTRQAITKAEIMDFEIGLPTIDVQRQTISRAQIVEDKTRALAELSHQKTKALDALKRSLLNRAFSGNLTGREPLAA